ncbi:MAG: TetR/AcrR family transcriptional regulator [Alphaproteobacteria bacterium]|nr:TetR/AcrR family transcriptional regulator [Myxococcales bacterium]MCB9688869.1 TetR/AcrR family transcriptional regulator [Alphaproteobacteria bacterium]MCB9700124.1 TetR/AcrR family transcriptional regulator [Alphaproteobacteria bacterium]
MKQASSWRSALRTTSRGSRSIQRIVDAAARMFGRDGFAGASMGEVARAAGVSKGLLHYHFDSKEQLLIEAVRTTFRQIHTRFSERFERGDRGLQTAEEALDALWGTVRDLSSWAPFMVETMSLATKAGPIRDDLFAFYAESEELLAQGIRDAFDGGPDPVLPPERLARLVRVGLHGLVVELSQARTDAERAEVEQAYRDLRDLFHRVSSSPPEVSP